MAAGTIDLASISRKGQMGEMHWFGELDPKGNCSAGDGVQDSVGANSGSRILRKEYAEDKARGQKSLTRDCVGNDSCFRR